MITAELKTSPRPEDVLSAAAFLADKAHHTPILSSQTLNQEFDTQLFFKCENFQRSGAFKYRGARYALEQLTAEQRSKGVATHSSGNHGAALAQVAKELNIDCTVIMPSGALASKIANVERQGARIIHCEPTQTGREQALNDWLNFSGAVPIPPYDHPHIIAGQGSVAVEMLDQLPDLDILMTPVGGGGLLAGCALGVVAKQPHIHVIGAEPAGAGDTADSLLAGERICNHAPDTIADGLRAFVGEMNFDLIQQHVEQVLMVDESQIIESTRILFERLKVVVEPSSATVLAAVRQFPHHFKGQRVGLVLTGGNIDLDQLPWLNS